MQKMVYGALAATLISTSIHAEVVQTKDGRTINLRDDGTYEIIEPEKQADTDHVEYQDHYFARHEGEYGQKRIRFMPIYKNTSDKKIIGAKFKARFSNAFGDEVFSFSGELDEPVAPGHESSHDMFYYFEDNQFISGEPYDKLLPLVTNKTGSIGVEFTTLAFEGGEIVKLTE